MDTLPELDGVAVFTVTSRLEDQMPTEPAYLSNLKKYARSQFETPEALEEIVVDLRRESDRGAIILSATVVEDSLENSIGKRMKPLGTDAAARAQIFGPDGVLSSYAHKILVAYCLEIIIKDERKQIDLIRQIRNACAHSRKPLSMQTPVLVAAVKAAIGAKMLAEAKDASSVTLRAGFIIHCHALAYAIATGQRLHPLEIFRIAMSREKEKP